MSNAPSRHHWKDELGSDHDRLLSRYMYSQEVSSDRILGICQKILDNIPLSDSATLATHVNDRIKKKEGHSIREAIAILVVDIRGSLLSNGIPLAYPAIVFDNADTLKGYVESQIAGIQQMQKKYRKYQPASDAPSRSHFDRDALQESFKWVESMLAFGVLCQEKIRTATDNTYKVSALAYAESWIARLKNLYTRETILMIHEDNSLAELKSSEELTMLMRRCSFPPSKESQW